MAWWQDPSQNAPHSRDMWNAAWYNGSQSEYEATNGSNYGRGYDFKGFNGGKKGGSYGGRKGSKGNNENKEETANTELPRTNPTKELLRTQLGAAQRVNASYLHQAFVECPADIDLDMGAVRAHVASLGLSALAYAAEDDGVCVDFAKASLLDAFLAAPPPSGAKVMRSWRCTQVPRLRYYLDAQTAWQVNRQSLVQEVGCVEVDKATNVLHFVRPEDATAAYLMHNGQLVNNMCKLTLKACEGIEA